MSETSVGYRVMTTPVQVGSDCVTIEPRFNRAELEQLERQLIPLLRTVQQMLGKEQHQTSAQRRAEQYRQLAK